MTVVGVERREILVRDASREEIVVVARNRNHREDLAVLRVHGDRGRPGKPVLLYTLAELGVEQLLETVVDREDDGVADGRPLESEGLDLALGRVALDFAPSVGAAQVPLVDLLDAGAADVVDREVACVLELFELVLGDRTRVADNRRIQRAVDVRADVLRSNLNAREELRALGDRDGDLPRHRHFRNSGRLVWVTEALRPDRVIDGVAGQVEKRAEALRQLLLARTREVDRDHAHREGRDVARQHVALPVDDAAALGGHGQAQDPVLLGEVPVVAAPNDLEVVEARRQRGEGDENGDAKRYEAPRTNERSLLGSHQTPSAPCFSVARRTRLATG